MECLEQGHITIDKGLEGDSRGARYPRRQITILALEAWEAALASLPDDLADELPVGGPRANLPWTTRRANLLIEGASLPQARGARIQIGNVILEVTGQTNPCRRMEEARPGLLKALGPDWRGGVTCRVEVPGAIALGDPLTVLSRPVEHRPRLPA